MYPEQKPTGSSEEAALKQGLRTLEVQARGLVPQAGEPDKFGYYTPKSWESYLNIYNLSAKIPDPSKLYTNSLIDDINKFDRTKIVEQAKAFKF